MNYYENDQLIVDQILGQINKDNRLKLGETELLNYITISLIVRKLIWWWWWKKLNSTLNRDKGVNQNGDDKAHKVCHFKVTKVRLLRLPFP